MRHLDLFSGIGGFALGLESTGHFETVAFCEIEEYPRRVLGKHWPGVPCYDDIRELTADRLAADGIGPVDIVTGGFPCQDLSLAGQRAGLSGERSGLWSELFRVIAEVRPRWVIAENVPGFRTLGADKVLADLAGAGYAAWPMVVGAVHAGAPHRRQRVWIVANSQRHDLRQEQGWAEPGWERAAEFGDNGEGGDAADAQSLGRSPEGQWRQQEQPRTGPDGKTWDAPNTKRDRRRSRAKEPGRQTRRNASGYSRPESDPDAADADSRRLERHARQKLQGQDSRPNGGSYWESRRAPEPVLRGVDARLPCGLHRRQRLKALGNAVVPQIVAAIGRAIVEVEKG